MVGETNQDVCPSPLFPVISRQCQISPHFLLSKEVGVGSPARAKAYAQCMMGKFSWATSDGRALSSLRNDGMKMVDGIEMS